MTITKIGEAIHQGHVLGYNLNGGRGGVLGYSGMGGGETINHGHVLGYSGMR